MQFKCEKCGQLHTLTVEMLKSSKWTAKADYPHLVGERASKLEPIGATTPKPVRAWTKSRTWERTVQAVLAGGATSIFCLAIGKPDYVSLVAPLTACAYWFGSTLLGAENWDVAFRFLDRNKDGRIDREDLQVVFDDWWEKGELDEHVQAEPVLSPFPVRVAGDDKAAEQGAVETAPTAWVGKTTADTPIVIRGADAKRTARIITLGELWEFLKVSHNTGDWTKATWTKVRGMSQPAWRDYQDFLQPLGFWKFTDDTPLLRVALRRFCAPGNYLTA